MTRVRAKVALEFLECFDIEVLSCIEVPRRFSYNHRLSADKFLRLYGILHVPTLRNPRHERFAQELTAGRTADAAYVLAGYRANRSNAARLNANPGIQKRLAEIQSVGAERAAITVESLIAEAEKARSKAMGERGGAAAAVAAITAKAKLAGLWRDKVAVTDPSGEKALRYLISEHPMTEEEWARERWESERSRPSSSRCYKKHADNLGDDRRTFC